MRVVCEACHKAITVPDDKVPAGRRFAFNCPACQHKIRVEPPAAAAEPATTTPAAQASPTVSDPETSFAFDDDTSSQVVVPSEPTAATASQPTATPAAGGSASGLPPLRPQEQALLQRHSPVALIVDHETPNDPTIAQDLQALGFVDLRMAESVEDAARQATEAEIGLVLVRVAKASAPPFAPLAPLTSLGPTIRRRTFIALAAENVQSLDGQVAFLLQVNCLLAHRDRHRFAEMLQRALLYDLKLYQHWDADIR